MEILEKFKNLPLIKPEVFSIKLKSQELVEGVAVCDDALEVLHEVLSFGDIPIKLKDCRIDGKIDFTKGPRVPLIDIGELSQERKDEMKTLGIDEVAIINGSLEIVNSFIREEVRCISHDRRIVVMFTAASFEGTSFGGDASFIRSTFGDGSRFQGANFKKEARFGGATFGDGADFFASTFSARATFGHAIFGKKANFLMARFEKRVSFHQATFGEMAIFDDANFGGVATFVRATFGDGASFPIATFEEESIFLETTFGDGASFELATFKGRTTFRGRRKREGHEEVTVFNGTVDFRQLNLESPKEVRFQHVNLSKARFLETPMDEVTFIDVDWTVSGDRCCIYDEITEEPKEKDFALIARLYRQLKKNYEEARDYHGAGDFHYGEMEMTLAQHRANWNKEWFEWLITRSYKLLSGYGEKARRAVALATWILIIPAICYYIGNMKSGDPPMPLPGFLDYFFRSFAYMTFRVLQPPSELWAKTLMSVQVLLGPIQIALAALALRRKFRR